MIPTEVVTSVFHILSSLYEIGYQDDAKIVVDRLRPCDCCSEDMRLVIGPPVIEHTVDVFRIVTNAEIKVSGQIVHHTHRDEVTA